MRYNFENFENGQKPKSKQKYTRRMKNELFTKFCSFVSGKQSTNKIFEKIKKAREVSVFFGENVNLEDAKRKI